jgi:hypothetical protein
MAKFRNYRLRPAFQPLTWSVDRRCHTKKTNHRRQADVAMRGVCQHYARLNVANFHHFNYRGKIFCTRCGCEVSQLYLRSTFAGIIRGFKEIVVSHEGVYLIDEALAAFKLTVRHDPLSRAAFAKGEGSRQAFFDCDITVDRNVARPK